MESTKSKFLALFGRKKVKVADRSPAAIPATNNIATPEVVLRPDGKRRRHLFTRRSLSPSIFLHKTALFRGDIIHEIEDKNETKEINGEHVQQSFDSGKESIENNVYSDDRKSDAVTFVRTLSESPRKKSRQVRDDKVHECPLGSNTPLTSEMKRSARLSLNACSLRLAEEFLHQRDEDISPQPSHDSGFDPRDVIIDNQQNILTATDIRSKMNLSSNHTTRSVDYSERLVTKPTPVTVHTGRQSHWSLSCSSSDVDADDKDKRVLRKTRSQLDLLRRRSMGNLAPLVIRNRFVVDGRHDYDSSSEDEVFGRIPEKLLPVHCDKGDNYEGGLSTYYRQWNPTCTHLRRRTLSFSRLGQVHGYNVHPPITGGRRSERDNAEIEVSQRVRAVVGRSGERFTGSSGTHRYPPRQECVEGETRQDWGGWFVTTPSSTVVWANGSQQTYGSRVTNTPYQPEKGERKSDHKVFKNHLILFYYSRCNIC